MFLTRHFITWRFFPVPTSGRDEISELAHNKSRACFIASIWAMRRKNMRARKPVRSLTWPATCLRDGVYVLPPSNVQPIKSKRMSAVFLRTRST